MKTTIGLCHLALVAFVAGCSAPNDDPSEGESTGLSSEALPSGSQWATSGVFNKIYDPSVGSQAWYINDHSFIRDAIVEGLLDRLDLVKRDFTHALDLGTADGSLARALRVLCGIAHRGAGQHCRLRRRRRDKARRAHKAYPGHTACLSPMSLILVCAHCPLFSPPPC